VCEPCAAGRYASDPGASHCLDCEPQRPLLARLSCSFSFSGLSLMPLLLLLCGQAPRARSPRCRSKPHAVYASQVLRSRLSPHLVPCVLCMAASAAFAAFLSEAIVLSAFVFGPSLRIHVVRHAGTFAGVAGATSCESCPTRTVAASAGLSACYQCPELAVTVNFACACPAGQLPACVLLHLPASRTSLPALLSHAFPRRRALHPR
jgi:hypothetical protein